MIISVYLFVTGFYGDSVLERAQVDMIVDCVNDNFTPAAPILRMKVGTGSKEVKRCEYLSIFTGRYDFAIVLIAYTKINSGQDILMVC